MLQSVGKGHSVLEAGSMLEAAAIQQLQIEISVLRAHQGLPPGQPLEGRKRR